MFMPDHLSKKRRQRIKRNRKTRSSRLKFPGRETGNLKFRKPCRKMLDDIGCSRT